MQHQQILSQLKPAAPILAANLSAIPLFGDEPAHTPEYALLDEALARDYGVRSVPSARLAGICSEVCPFVRYRFSVWVGGRLVGAALWPRML